MKKKFLTAALAGIIAISSFSTAFAGQWQQDPANARWKYFNDAGAYFVNGWQWIDGNADGIAECYYFDANGYCLMNTTTPDNYTVDVNGSWVVNGIIQTQSVEIAKTVPIANHQEVNPAVLSGQSISTQGNITELHMLINYSQKIQDIFLEMLKSWKQVDIQDVKRMDVIK